MDESRSGGAAPAPVAAPSDRTVSIMKACDIAGVSRRTIYNWIKAGKLAYRRTAGGQIRIFESSLWQDPAQDDEV